MGVVGGAKGEVGWVGGVKKNKDAARVSMWASESSV